MLLLATTISLNKGTDFFGGLYHTPACVICQMIQLKRSKWQRTSPAQRLQVMELKLKH